MFGMAYLQDPAMTSPMAFRSDAISDQVPLWFTILAVVIGLAICSGLLFLASVAFVAAFDTITLYVLDPLIDLLIRFIFIIKRKFIPVTPLPVTSVLVTSAPITPTHVKAAPVTLPRVAATTTKIDLYILEEYRANGRQGPKELFATAETIDQIAANTLTSANLDVPVVFRSLKILQASKQEQNVSKKFALRNSPSLQYSPYRNEPLLAASAWYQRLKDIRDILIRIRLLNPLPSQQDSICKRAYNLLMEFEAEVCLAELTTEVAWELEVIKREVAKEIVDGLITAGYHQRV